MCRDMFSDWSAYVQLKKNYFGFNLIVKLLFYFSETQDRSSIKEADA